MMLIFHYYITNQNMKTDKEYPATHSMATAWYCVDEDGNVGIFDIDDNGPVPVGDYRQICVEDLIWDEFASESKNIIKDLNLTPTQVESMLEPFTSVDSWEYSDGYWMNTDWMGTIIKIDMSKLDIFLQAAEMDVDTYQRPICISKEQGLFYVDFYWNKAGVDLMEENNVIIARYKAPRYESPHNIRIPEDNEETRRKAEKYPLYIYLQDYWPYDLPAIRLNNPVNPMKLEQLPKEIQEKIRKLPIKFKDTERIQLAELIPVDGIGSPEYVYDNKIWWELASSDNSRIYYNIKSNTFIKKEKMDELIAKGEAEEYDWHKHEAIKD